MSNRPEPIYRVLASAIGAMRNCDKHGNTEWLERHRERIDQIVSDHLPSGAGWDCGTKIDLVKSTDERIVFYGSFHHMNDGGYYDGWTGHTITVRPSLWAGITISISGRNRNDIKEYLHEMFDCDLHAKIRWDDAAGRYVAAD